MTQQRLIIGCGYLGRRVARNWSMQGDTVFALTRTSEHAEEFRQSGLTPIIGDITDAASLAGLPAVDTILFAVGLDRGTSHSQHDVYVSGLDNVLYHLEGKVRRLIYISSTSVYGQNEEEWVDESSDCRPDSPNGQVCLDAERLLQHKVPQANILRLAGLYGPGRVVARIEALRAGQVPEGNPDAWLNLIHVDDAVAAVLACERRGVPGATYLVCDDSPCRRREYYSLLADMIGAPAPFPSPATDRRAGGVSPRIGKPVPLTSIEKSQISGLNKRCSNRRLRDELQVVLRYPRFNIGLPNALTTR
jgi:nucleoside-diphosphate-sugar epimerase